MKRQATRDDWPALWIWADGHSHRNEYVLARKRFRLGGRPTAARVRITADNRYQLHVNGRFVCRGPARCEPRHQAYDEVDLAPYLRRGLNCIAVLAHHIGESTFQSVERGGFGFLLDGEVSTGRGRSVPLHTNETWRATPAAAHRRESARYAAQLGFQEDFDAAAAVPGWAQPDFDDSAWSPARVLGVAGMMPYEHLEPRGIPLERELPAGFVAVRGAFEGESAAGYREPGDVAAWMASEQRVPARGPILRNIPGCLAPGGEPMTVLPAGEGRFHALVLDAGSETAGFVNLDVEAAGGEIIDFYYGEHVHEDTGDPYIRAANGALISMADRYRCRPGRQLHQFFAWKGFRYVLAVFRDVQAPLRVHRLGFTFTSYPVERRGAFECSDALLNDVWRIGAWTQQLCMHDAYIDCPWREQAQWWGDARVQWRVNRAVFGDADLFRRGLRQAAQSQLPSGLTYGVFPSEAHACIVPDFTLAWVSSLWDHCRYTGDDAPVVEHFEAVVRALGWFERHAGRERLCGRPERGLWLFLDWAPLDKEDRSATFTLHYLEALRAAAAMARHLHGRFVGLKRAPDWRGQAGRFEAQARAVERAVVRAFWDAEAGHFHEGYRLADGRRRQVSQHANALAILAGLQPRRHADLAGRIGWMLAHHERLLASCAGGNEYRPGAAYAIASPYFYAFVLEALFKAGRGDVALAAIRMLWGRMVLQRATTWHENWDHGPANYGFSSACHAWSASPTYHLSEQIGGIAALAPGFARVRIAPNVLDLDFAAVSYPVSRGIIEVRWERRHRAGIDLEVRLPRGVIGEVAVPGCERELPPGRHHIRSAGPSSAGKA